MQPAPPPATSSSTGRRVMRSGIWLVIVAAAVAAAFVLPQYIEAQGQLQAYAVAGQRMIDGEPIYREEATAFMESPAVALICTLAALAPQALTKMYAAVCVGLMLVIVIAISRWHALLSSERRNGLARSMAFWLLLILGCAAYATRPILEQRLDLLLLALATVALVQASRWHDVRAGFCAGALAVLQPFMAIFGLVFIWQWRFWALAAITVGLALGVALPELIYPPQVKTLWITQFERERLAEFTLGVSPDVVGGPGQWTVTNQSLAGTMHRFFTPPRSGEVSHETRNIAPWTISPAMLRALTTLAQLGLLVWLWILSRRSLTNSVDDHEFALRRFGEGAAAICTMLLIWPYTTPAHFCLLMLPIAFGLSHLILVKHSWLVVMLLLVAAGSGLVSTPWTAGGTTSADALAHGSLTAGALACLLACSRILLMRNIDGQTPLVKPQAPLAASKSVLR